MLPFGYKLIISQHTQIFRDQLYGLQSQINMVSYSKMNLCLTICRVHI